MEEEYQTGRVSRKQPYSTPTHAADGGRTAPTNARHVTRLKGARDHVIHEAICEREQVYGQRLIGVPPSLSLGVQWKSTLGQVSAAVSVPRPSRHSRERPLSCLRAPASFVLHPDLYYYYRIARLSRSPGAQQQPLQMHFLVVKPLPVAAVAAAATTTSYRSLSDTRPSPSHQQ